MTDSTAIAMVITTVETSGDAEQLARWLVEQSLAACVQIDGPITSHYRWDETLQQSQEYRLMIKTARKTWPAIRDQLPSQHPYDEPEIILLPIEEATDGYRNWVIAESG